MNSELDLLLNSAKENLRKKPEVEKKEESANEVIQSIPKLDSKMNTNIETLEADRVTNSGDHKLKSIPLKNIKAKKPDTAGQQWFDLGKPEMTPELKRDLQLLKMRHVLDPKRFYKKEDAPSKYFAVGTIQSDPTEFFSNRLTKKQRKQTLAEEVLSTRSDYFKSKYRDIQKAKTSGRRKHQKKLRDMRS